MVSLGGSRLTSELIVSPAYAHNVDGKIQFAPMVDVACDARLMLWIPYDTQYKFAYVFPKGVHEHVQAAPERIPPSIKKDLFARCDLLGKVGVTHGQINKCQC